MKDQIKITVIATGFKETGAKRSYAPKQTFLPKTWKAQREQQQQLLAAAGGGGRDVVQEVARNVSSAMGDVPADDLDVPTFLRRQASKA
jgi:hypothetical protein